ncbi:hypothetical protein LOTGIDRAFT_142206 [Lottia gigantea]|uniref:Acid ceramidase n=1 Tax=Lottia gigantea TaxID=225164 RepID=V4AZF3_LOTGI|nr:hypothetical protein LOTGIDRAFT_142206 [Lottia gigantea]ESO99106.1 hypothetical protein LOTGIDRAFT_142206 [Lottia gigantea]
MPFSLHIDKEYIVNLDLPPEERWKEVAQAKAPQIRKVLSRFKEFVADWGKDAEELIKLVDTKFGQFDDTIPGPFRGEIMGMAKYSNMNLGEIVLYNIFYEVFTVCTSIVAQDSAGKLFHARNLDFGLFIGWDIKNKTWAITEVLKPAIINLRYTRSGITVFKSVNFAGYIGILSGIKPNMFTLTMNERFNADGGFIGIIEWILGIRTGSWMGFLTRSVLENATSYEEARLMLTKEEMLAPAYFILGGLKPGEACVITRARESTIDVWEMPSAGGWYILETNYDHWKAPLFLDDRRTPANNCMKNMTQSGVSIKGLFNVLNSKPVLNKLTTYTALMQVDTGHLETYIANCTDPCFPW